MKPIILIILGLLFFHNVQSQTVVVNPDGTHSIGIDHGGHSVVVNPDGTHSVAVNHGNHAVVVNPDGTHSIGIDHGGHTVVVNPDGTHSVAVNHGNHAVVLNPHNSNTVGAGILNTNSNGKKKSFAFVYSEEQSHENDWRGIASDSLFLKDSEKVEEELYKLEVLKMVSFINKKEYRKLKSNTQLIEDYYSLNKGNQLYELVCSKFMGEINRSSFKKKKREIVASNKASLP